LRNFKVEIRAEPLETDQVKLVVMNNGVGTAAKHLGQTLKDFEQLDAGTSRRYEGTSLDMALTRKFMELQGGTIGVESEFGQGGIFPMVLHCPGRGLRSKPTHQKLNLSQLIDFRRPRYMVTSHGRTMPKAPGTSAVLPSFAAGPACS
jgi:hypothetical protein